MNNIVALIPARGGSVRVLGKNIRLLGGQPLIAWTIQAARAAGLEHVYVSSDSPEVLTFAADYGADWIHRPPEFATAESPDIGWVRHAIGHLSHLPDILVILRPTSPFRSGTAIKDALEIFQSYRPSEVDSLRAMRIATEHPAKMWRPRMAGRVEKAQLMVPIWEGKTGAAPWHSSQTNTLPICYVQTGGLEIVWRQVVERMGTIAGLRVLGYLLDGEAAFDINTEADWAEAVRMVEDLAAGHSGSHARAGGRGGMAGALTGAVRSAPTRPPESQNPNVPLSTGKRRPLA